MRGLKLFHSSNMRKTKPVLCFIIFPLYFYRFTHISFSETPILFGKSLYNLAKLRLLPDCTGVLLKSMVLLNRIGFCQIVYGFCQIVSDFCQIVYTFWQKNPRTEVHPLPNVKLPLKTQENNVTFKPMYCQECRIYGLCEVSATLSTEN